MDTSKYVSFSVGALLGVCLSVLVIHHLKNPCKTKFLKKCLKDSSYVYQLHDGFDELLT